MLNRNIIADYLIISPTSRASYSLVSYDSRGVLNYAVVALRSQQLMSCLTSLEAVKDHPNTVKHDSSQYEPRRGCLIALKSKTEIQHAHIRTIEVYITTIPLKAASSTLRFVHLSYNLGNY